jgi:hypothetical protein
MRDAHQGGLGQLADAVRGRIAPFIGFCGGAQLLALLEARSERRIGSPSGEIDAVLRRNDGQRIRGFAPPSVVERSWPGETPVRQQVVFAPHDPLFADIAGPARRRSTHAFPESHFDVIRPDAFLQDAPLRRFEVLATSTFCTPHVIAASTRDRAFPDPQGRGSCAVVPEVYRSRDPGFPVIGAQFHPEQREFAIPAGGDPPESVSDPRLFLAGAYEQIVDAYLQHAR